MAETKSVTLVIRVTPTIKELAEKRAAEEQRSVASYIAYLVAKDAKPKRRR